MARDPLWPSLRQAQVCTGDRIWRATFSEDLAEALLAEALLVASAPSDALSASATQALSESLVLPGDRAWRLGVDVDGLLVGMAVDPQACTLHLGSPRFGAERFLVSNLCDRHDPPKDWQAHVSAWQRADPAAAPLDVARSTALLALPDLLDPKHEGARPDSPLLTHMRTLGAELASRMGRYRPGLWERINGFGLGLQADYAVLRVHLLRFVALLPSLDHDMEGVEVRRLLVEMFRRLVTDSERARLARRVGERGPLPVLLEAACRVAGVVARLLPARQVSTLTRAGVRLMARSFIAGEDIVEAQPALMRLRASGRSATLDQLGELVVR